MEQYKDVFFEVNGGSYWLVTAFGNSATCQPYSSSLKSLIAYHAPSLLRRNSILFHCPGIDLTSEGFATYGLDTWFVSTTYW